MRFNSVRYRCTNKALLSIWREGLLNHSDLQGLTIPNDLPNNCNYSDLCSDGGTAKDKL